MAKRKQVGKVSLDNEAVQEILTALLQEFRQRHLGADELRTGYKGLSPAELKRICCTGGAISNVDFDLAMKDLVDADLVSTGPKVPYENTPGSMVVILSLYSKNEYAFLTEDGYKAAAKARPKAPPHVPSTSVHISGGTFNQSPIGIGSQVQQTVNLNAATEELFSRLRDEIQAHVADAEKQTAALAHLESLEAAPDKPTAIARYNQLVGSIADHMTVLGPFLNPLLQQILS